MKVSQVLLKYLVQYHFLRESVSYFFSCKGSTFPSLERLVNALKYGEVDGILVDLYTAHYRNDLFNVTWIVVSQIIPFKFTSGVVISGNAAKLEQHFRDYIGNKSTVVVTDVLQKTNQDNNKVGRACPLCVSVIVQNGTFCCWIEHSTAKDCGSIRICSGTLSLH